MHYFKLMEVLDPNVVHGPHLRRHLIGTPDDISVVAGKLVHLFEVPLHGSGLDSPENIKNSFTVFKVSDICANVWKDTIKKQRRCRHARQVFRSLIDLLLL